MPDANTNEDEGNTTEPVPDEASRANPNEWTLLDSMPSWRLGARGVAIDDYRFLVIGGYDETIHNTLASSVCFDARTQKWENFPVDLPTGRYSFGVAIIGNRVYVLGGHERHNKFSDVLSIDVSGADLSAVSGRTWNVMPSMNKKRHSFACASHSTWIYVFGGRDKNDKTLDTAARYNTEAKEWNDLPPMPGGPRESCAAGVVGNRIFVVGGDDKHYNKLASTIVFDTATQQWESQKATTGDSDSNNDDPTPIPAVPDMKRERSSVTVVSVDHFVVAISGVDKIAEVLDTERNAWKLSPKSTKKVRSNFAAGFLKATNEVIVGGDDDTAEIIQFEKGLLPRIFRVKERAQEVKGDTPHGKDRLGLAIIAQSLAEALAIASLEPPFVLGVLGKWGRGKSYFMNLMLNRLIDIQMRPIDPFDKLIENNFAGHIYVVQFDSWTFSKGNIWSSIMYQILKELNEQLQFEQALINEVKNGEVSTIAVFRGDLSRSEIKYLKDHHKEVFARIERNGDSPSDSLREAINVNYKEDEKKLELIDQKIRGEILEKEAKRAVEELKIALNFLGRMLLDYFLKNNLEEISADTKGQSIDDMINENKGDIEDLIEKEQENIDEIIKTVEKIEDIEDLINEEQENIDEIIKEVEKIRSGYLWSFILGISNISTLAFIIFFLLIGAMVLLVVIYQQIILAYLSGTLAIVIPVVTSILSAKEKIDPLVTQFRNQVTALNEDLEAGSTGESEVLKKLRNQKMSLEAKNVTLKGLSLRDTISKKFDENDYENDLGIVHKVQKDLQSISESMLNKKQEDNIFPRGKPRIVLIVDDLDRCEQDVVVQVIEALQLVVKTKLFVAVLAIDPRYVCLALEKKYNGILNQRIPPTGMDFLEKIIQIPFRLPEIRDVSEFLDSQIDVEEPQDDSEDTGAQATSPVESSGTVKSQNVENDSKPNESNATINKKEIDPGDEDLSKNIVRFEKSEKSVMKETMGLFQLGPRSLRRVINVFKQFKLIWKRDTRFNPDMKTKKASLFLMLLASDESTREVTYKIFEWMELGMMRYHHVLPKQDGKNLAKLFMTELHKHKKGNFDLESSFDGEQPIEGTLMYYIQEYLHHYKWTCLDEWKKVSFQFMLVRSFSFFRLVTEEMDPRTWSSCDDDSDIRSSK